MTTPKKLNALRSLMAAKNIAACIIPSSDPHQSEYFADHWKSRQWLSGFSGSAGTLVVTADHARLWTDFRYYILAAQQLEGSGIEMQKSDISQQNPHLDWLNENLPAGSKLALDGRLFSVGQVRRMSEVFSKKKMVLETGLDLVAAIWRDRPPMPQDAVFQHSIKYAGVTCEQKLQKVRTKMGDADAFLLSTLDDIAWLFNLRGSDVECNPVFYAYAVVEREVAYLFIEPSKISGEIKNRLNADGVLVKSYDAIEPFLENFPGISILLDLASTSNQTYSVIPKEKIREAQNIVIYLKAIKNPVEIQHIRQVMCKDGVALVRLFRWLESTLAERPVPETEVAERLIAFRRMEDTYFGESFDAIVGYNANSAIVHYRPEKGKCAVIRSEGILLLDSGGQYQDGTTDITRTIALSPPTERQKRDFTLVLKGFIALSIARFPKGICGIHLDTLTRQFLWQDHLNYGHGAGHGVGFFLNVHEPPQGFSPANAPRTTLPFEPGMLTSNEPGLYREGEYGIRTENLVLCVEDGEPNAFGTFRRFETMTLYPIDLQLVEENLLTPGEREWLNGYHREVFEKLSPLLDEGGRKWLEGKCGQV